MRASEWQYLCAVHEPPRPCCAIDYSCHTLDWAGFQLTSTKIYPSRLTLSEGTGGVKNLGNIMRRVYRIFAHAWFSHRSTFWEVEGREGLYILLKTVCDVHGLMSEENYTIPKEAEEGSKDESSAESARSVSSPKKPNFGSPEKKARGEEGTATAFRRHKATPSVGSAVTTIQEGDEEDSKEGGAVGLRGGLLEKLAEGSKAEAPLAVISKTAEKIDVPPLKDEDEDDAKAAKKSTTKDESAAGDTSVKSEESASQNVGDLQRRRSTDSVATIVKVEEKENDED